jgi:hypothetical protein
MILVSTPLNLGGLQFESQPLLTIFHTSSKLQFETLLLLWLQFSKEHLQYIIYSDGSIPLVPSPGMTEDEERALKGTEAKENILPEGVLPSQAEERNMAGILQPSRYFPCNPQDDPALQAV